MNLAPLKAALRSATPAPARGAGERWAEGGKVALASQDGGYQLVVSGGGRNEVWLWPDDAEWECECEAPSDGCAHAWAALLALQAGGLAAAAEPPRLLFDLSQRADRLELRLTIVEGDQERPFAGPTAGLTLDPVLERLLKMGRSWSNGQVPPRQYALLLAAALTADGVRLDGVERQVSRRPLDQVAVLDRVGRGFRLTLGDPDEVLVSLPGEPTLLVTADAIRPRGFGRLSEVQRHQLRHPLVFAPHELPKLTAEWLPSLERAVTVVRREAVPEARPGGLELVLVLEQGPGMLEATPRLVYGDPPVAEVRGEQLLPLGGVQALPPRDRRRERALIARLNEQLRLAPAQRLRLFGAEAAEWVRHTLPRFDGAVAGEAARRAFTVAEAPLDPDVSWAKGRLRVSFGNGEAVLGLPRVLDAFHRGDSLVALPAGGFAELPLDWLREHAEQLEGLGEGAGPHLAPLAAELLEAAGVAPPPDLRGLVDALRSGVPELPPPDELQAELRGYQRTGQSWLRFLAEQGLGGVLADDMGLGKTVQALTLLLARRGDGPALVVAPTSVLRNWVAEAARFTPALRTALLHGPARKRQLARLAAGELDLLVTSWGTLRRDVDTLADIDFSTVVLDEAQAIKNADSLTAQAARRLRARQRVALTGTPVENRLAELWSLFEFLNPGFFGPRRAFEERLGNPASSGDPRAIAALRARVRPFILRRLKQDVAPELPPRTETVLRCALGPEQRAAYERVRRGALSKLTGEPNQRMQILAALTRLRQAACDPALLPGGDDAPSSKLDLMMETLDELVEEGHRALVFSQWTSLLDRVEPRLAEAGMEWLRLDGSTRDRQALVDRFQAPDGPPVFLISLKAGGTGLNLTAADHVIHLDPWWNPAAERQASDRAHRIGQTRPVFVWKLVAEDTVEDDILSLQERKQALADAVLEGGDGAASLSEGDLLALLQPSP